MVEWSSFDATRRLSGCVRLTSGDTVHYDAPQRAMITACAIGAAVLQLLDPTIANVALPYMQGSFSSSFGEITRVLGLG
jgi:hypothetical protein